MTRIHWIQFSALLQNTLTKHFSKIKQKDLKNIFLKVLELTIFLYHHFIKKFTL